MARSQQQTHKVVRSQQSVHDQRASFLPLADALGFVFLLSVLTVLPGTPDPNAFPKMVVLTLGAAALAPFVLRGWVLEWRSLSRGKLAVALAGCLLTIWICLSAFVSDAPAPLLSLGWPGFWDGALVATAILVIFMGTLLLDGRGRDRILDWFLVATTTTVAVGVLQLFGLEVAGTGVGGSVVGTLGNTNFAAAFWAISIPLALCQTFRKGPTPRRIWMGCLAVGCALLAVVSGALQGPILLAFGLVSFGVLAVWGGLATLTKRQRSVSFIVGMGALVAMFASAIAWRKSLWQYLSEQETLQFRFEYWSTALDIAQQFPVWGVGPGNLARYVSEFRTSDYVSLVGPDVRISAAHNVLLNLAAGSGYVAAFLWLAAFIVGLVMGLVVLGRQSSRDSLLVAGLVSSLATYLLQSVVSIDVVALWLTGWILLGLVTGAAQDPAMAPVPTTGQRPPEVNRKPDASSQVSGPHRRSRWTAATASALLVTLMAFLLVLQGSALANAISVQSAQDLDRVLRSPFTPCEARVALLRDPFVASDPTVAAQAMITAAEVDPRCSPVLAYATEAAIASGDLADAEPFSKEGVAIDPMLSISWYVKARYEQAAGNPRQALDDLREAERLEGLYPEYDPTAAQAIAKLREEIMASEQQQPVP